MRLLFVCQHCGARYLTPADLVRSGGGRASAVWCGPCQTAARDGGVAEPAELAAVAMLLAVRALRTALAARLRREAARRPDRRPTR
ncbi:hypothetical protein, partial [Kitasatospora sp. MBT63]